MTNKMLNRWFPFKYRRRVVALDFDRCFIEYAYYRIFPDWLPLQIFKGRGNLETGQKQWHTVHLSQARCEELALSLKSIDDVIRYETPTEETLELWDKECEEYKESLSKQYRTKEIHD